MQPWKKITIAISRKYLKKGFQQDKENKKKVNENKVKDMQANHGSHVAKMIYACRI